VNLLCGLPAACGAFSRIEGRGALITSAQLPIREEVPTNFYRRFPGDYLRDTQHLSLTQHGIYCLLLDTLYSIEKPIKDRAAAYRICRCSEHAGSIAECDAVIDEFFIESRAGIWHSKVESEVKYAESRRLTARTAANVKWSKHAPSNAPSMPPASVEQCYPDSRLQTPETSNSTPKPSGVLFEVPIWIPQPAWQAYVEMRGTIRPKTALLIFKKLQGWMEAGDDPGLILEQSVVNGWKGIFPLRKEATNGQPASEQRSQRVRAAAAAVLGTTGPMGRALRGELREGTDRGNISHIQDRPLRLGTKVSP
jgi:uncharacterized protein YdaU (DUF1376 family)